MSLPGFEPVRRTSVASDVRDSRAQLRVLFILGVLPTVVIALLATKAVDLPAASLVSIALAAGIAIYAWRAQVNYRSQGLTFWDLAGMLAFIGFGAGALADPNDVLQLFGMNPTN